MNTKELYARYKAEQSVGNAARAAASAALTKRTRAQLATLKAQADVQRQLIRLAPTGGPRAALLSVHAAAHRASLDKVLVASKQERAKLRASSLGWLEWLQHQALAGDGQALAALRDRARGEPRPTLGLEAGEGRAPFPADSVTKTGVFIYCTPSATVRDDGTLLHVSRGVEDKGLLIALQIAKDRHDGVLRVAGDASFQARVARLAALTDPTIRFADPVLERRRAGIALQLEKRQLGSGYRGSGAGLRGRGGSPAIAVGQSGPALRRADGTRADRSAAQLAGEAARILRGPISQSDREGPRRQESIWQWPSLSELSRRGLENWRRGPERLSRRVPANQLVDAPDRADEG